MDLKIFVNIKLIILCFALCCTFSNTAQTKKKAPINSSSSGSNSGNSSTTQKPKASINQYLIISKEQDTTFVDTTLTVQKEYKYNYLRKDNFNLIQFANIGQTYNTLSFNSSSTNLLPLFGARARHYNYMEIEDINYFHVPTPLSELFYKTAFEQGQILDAFFTINTSERFNFSIAYKGLRSLGNYLNALTSTGNFRLTTNYRSRNNKYNMRGHIVLQDLLNQENGGLTDEDVARFEAGDEQVTDRSVFDPNFENAENILEGKRFHLEHSYDLISKKDSLSYSLLRINNTVSFEDKFYQFDQTTAASDFFGEAFSTPINDKVTLEHFYSDIGVSFSNNILGNLNFRATYNDINYGYNSLVLLNNETITNRIKTNFLGFKAGYQKQLGAINLNANIGANLSDEIKGNYLDANISYRMSDDLNLSGGLNINSRLPNYNQLLYQSDYTNYNWDNQGTFNNINTQQISITINSKKYLKAKLDITNIDNHTYFNQENVVNNVKVIKPVQYNSAIQYLRLKVQKEIRYGKFALDNTILYQNVSNGDNILNVPNFVTRNTLYYTDEVFKKALKFQAGVIFNYFTQYNANGYDPLLAEFYTQNDVKIGGFPRLDFFVNAKVRQTRIFIKAEHFNSSFTGYNYFVAPNHPYRDFTIRFGLVWNFFL